MEHPPRPKQRKLLIQADPEEVQQRQDSLQEVLDGATQEQSVDSEYGKELWTAVTRVAQLFNALGVEWKFNGALNISLRNIAAGKKSFFRKHRDIDVQITSPLSGKQLAEKLRGLGYGVCTVKENAKKEVMTIQLTGDAIPAEGLKIFRLDSKGYPTYVPREPMIDLHVGMGKTISGKDLPSDWGKIFTPTIDGETLHLEHPASILYYKLLFRRKRDLIDIDSMVQNGQLEKNNVEKVRQVVEDDLHSTTLHTDQRTALETAQMTLDELEQRLS